MIWGRAFPVTCGRSKLSLFSPSPGMRWVRNTTPTTTSASSTASAGSSSRRAPLLRPPLLPPLRASATPIRSRVATSATPPRRIKNRARPRPPLAQADGGFRVATSLWYLVDTPEGGETAFPGALTPGLTRFFAVLSAASRICSLLARFAAPRSPTPPRPRPRLRAADSVWADPSLAAGEWSECAQDRVATRAKKGCGAAAAGSSIHRLLLRLWNH